MEHAVPFCFHAAGCPLYHSVFSVGTPPFHGFQLESRSFDSTVIISQTTLDLLIQSFTPCVICCAPNTALPRESDSLTSRSIIVIWLLSLAALTRVDTNTGSGFQTRLSVSLVV